MSDEERSSDSNNLTMSDNEEISSDSFKDYLDALWGKEMSDEENSSDCKEMSDEENSSGSCIVEELVELKSSPRRRHCPGYLDKLWGIDDDIRKYSSPSYKGIFTYAIPNPNNPVNTATLAPFFPPLAFTVINLDEESDSDSDTDDHSVSFSSVDELDQPCHQEPDSDTNDHSHSFSKKIPIRTDWWVACLSKLISSIAEFDNLSKAKVRELVMEQFLLADLRQSSGGRSLPENVDAMHNVVLPGPFVLQVNEIINLSAHPKDKFQEVPSGITRCLKLSMTDGVQSVVGMEHRPIKDLHVLAPAGFKVLIENVCVQYGRLMLVPDDFKILGGVVEALEEKANRTRTSYSQEVEEGALVPNKKPKLTEKQLEGQQTEMALVSNAENAFLAISDAVMRQLNLIMAWGPDFECDYCGNKMTVHHQRARRDELWKQLQVLWDQLGHVPNRERRRREIEHEGLVFLQNIWDELPQRISHQPHAADRCCCSELFDIYATYYKDCLGVYAKQVDQAEHDFLEESSNLKEVLSTASGYKWRKSQMKKKKIQAEPSDLLALGPIREQLRALAVWIGKNHR